MSDPHSALMPSKMLLQISNLNNISTETNNTIFEVKVYSQNEYNSELILIILKFPNFALLYEDGCISSDGTIEVL